jgi:hypothetical protein
MWGILYGISVEGFVCWFYIKSGLMVEFSEDLSKRFTGVEARERRAYHRLAVGQGEIPYFNGGLDKELFKYDSQDLVGHIRALLSDFQVEVSVTHGRVTVGDVRVVIPGFSE